MHSCAVSNRPYVPTPTERERKQEHIHIASCMVFTLPPALSCPDQDLHRSYLDYWISLLLDTTASTQYSREEHRNKRQT